MADIVAVDLGIDSEIACYLVSMSGYPFIIMTCLRLRVLKVLVALIGTYL